jgi:hypothetical protein
MIDKDIEDLVSTFEALKGQSPYSGAPGVVIEQLIEQGLTRFGPSLRNVAEGYRQWMIHQLELFRQYGIAEKTIAKAGIGQKWTVDKFKGADIMGAVTVRVQSDSTIPRSSQVEIAKVLEAINASLVDISNPMTRLKVLQKLKIPDLMEDIENDVIAAVKENEGLAAGIPPAVTPFLDNHVIHIIKHKVFVQSDEGAPFKDFMMQHIAEHNMMNDAETMQAPIPEGGGGAPSVSPDAAEKMNPGGQAQGQLPPGIA